MPSLLVGDIIPAVFFTYFSQTLEVIAIWFSRPLITPQTWHSECQNILLTSPHTCRISWTLFHIQMDVHLQVVVQTCMYSISQYWEYVFPFSLEVHGIESGSIPNSISAASNCPLELGHPAAVFHQLHSTLSLELLFRMSVQCPDSSCTCVYLGVLGSVCQLWYGEFFTTCGGTGL